MGISLSLGKSRKGALLEWDCAGNPHIYISGQSGMGKSFLIRRLVSQVPGQKAHVVVLDTSQDFEGYWTLPDFCGEDDIPINRLKVKSPEVQLNPLRALAAERERGETPEEIAMRVSGVVGEICHLRELQAMYLSTAIVRFLKGKSGGGTRWKSL